MISVQFSRHDFKIKQQADKEFIWDELRKQWLALTPEEWVRQNFIQYLIQQMQYPATLIGLEKEIRLEGLKKRFDIVVFDTAFKPWMLIECKAMNVQLNENVLQQLLRYNQVLRVQYLVLTNGVYTRGFQLWPSLVELHVLPVYAVIKT